MKLKYIMTLVASAAVFTSCEKANEAATDTTDVAAVREAATAEVAEAVERADAEKAAAAEKAATENLQYKLDNIIIPSVDIIDLSVEECIELLRQRARAFDQEPDEKRKGLNFVIQNHPGAADIGTLKVDRLALKNAPLQVVLEYICDKARLRYQLKDNAIVLLPLE